MPIYQIGNQTIAHSDCLEHIRTMESESVDVVVTSPPYNIKKKYNTYEDNLSDEDYLEWMRLLFVEVKRVLKDSGSFFLNIGFTNKQPYINIDVCNVARKLFVLQNNISWVKSISIRRDNWESYGHFRPIVSGRYLNQQHESIYHFTKDGITKIDRLAVGVPYADKSNLDRYEKVKSDLRCRGNVWFIPYKTVSAGKGHPAGYPVELPLNCILLHGLTPDLVVLDPFLGAGTTLIACQKLGCRGVGIEVDEKYCELSMDNILHYENFI